MKPVRRVDLTARVAALHGFGGADPTDERIREQLESRGRAAMWPVYDNLRRQEVGARTAGNDALGATFAEAGRMTLNSWYEAGDVVREALPSRDLVAQVATRSNFARRFDPIRSTVEQDALRRRKIDATGETADLRHVHPDLCAEFGIEDLVRSYESRVGDDLARAGIEDAMLIRNLDMVESRLALLVFPPPLKLYKRTDICRFG